MPIDNSAAIVAPPLAGPLPYHLKPGAEALASDACPKPPCESVFDRVVVSRLIHGGTTVMFDLVEGFNDTGTYVFWLEYGSTSNPGADDWNPVVGPLEDVFFAIDYEQRVFGTTDWGFYRVRMETDSGIYLSDPVNALGTLAWRDWNMAQEILRKERLLARLAHESGYLLKRRLSGPVCNRCVDRQTRAPRDPDCPVCYGTGYICGYYAPMPCVWAGLSPKSTHIQLDGGAGRGTVDNDTGVTARMLVVPVMIETDVWISKHKDTRYFIHKIQNVAEWRGVPLVGQVELRPVPFTSVIYDLQIEGQTDSDDSC